MLRIQAIFLKRKTSVNDFAITAIPTIKGVTIKVFNLIILRNISKTVLLSS